MAKDRLTHDMFLEKAINKNQHFANGEIEVVGQYCKTNVPIKCLCSRGHLFFISPDKIFVGQGCSYCSNHRVLVGFNDLFTTRPDVAKLLKNPEDGYKYTSGSTKYVEFQCDRCGNIINKRISEVCNHGI